MGLESGLRPTENAVGTEVVFGLGSDRVNGCFMKINQRVAGSTVVGQMVGQHELMWLWPDLK